MAEFTIPEHGTICWRELASRDLSAAKHFYRELFGWELAASKVNTSPAEYTEIQFGGTAVGGMMAIDESWGDDPPPSHWSAYIAVDNADEAAKRITENGGAVRHGPFDAPGVGRICLATDPCGANFAMIEFEKPS